MIAFGKQRLKFEKVHISNFRNDWIVGVDTKPFYEEFVKPDEQKSIEQIYYIQFEGEPGRQLIVALHKKSRTWLFSLRALRSSVASALKMGH
jgi:hypothetical protein